MLGGRKKKWIFFLVLCVWDSLDYITCFLAHYRSSSSKVEIVSVSSLHVDSVGGF